MSPGPRLRWLVVLATLALARSAHADLMSDLARVRQGWRSAGGRVERAETHFLLAGEVRALRPLAKRSRSGGQAPCRSLLLMSERPLSFTLRTTSAHPTLLPPVREHSEAGVVWVEDCGAGPLAGGQLELAMGAARGAVEILAVSHALPLPTLGALLPERTQGPVATPSDMLGAMTLAPLAERLARARDGAREEGARMVVTVTTRADEAGVGAIALRLSEGCHRLAVLADQTTVTGAVDVDVEARTGDGDEVLSRDQSHAPDGRLDFCLGEVSEVELRYLGAGGAATLHVVDAHWPMAPGIRSDWGARAKAAMSWALHRRRLPAPASAPLLDVLGAAGATQVPFRVEPGACYLAAFASLRGEATAARLGVRLGERVHHDDGSDEPRAGAVSFCAASDEELATLQIELRAQASWWVASVWQVGRLGR